MITTTCPCCKQVISIDPGDERFWDNVDKNGPQPSPEKQCEGLCWVWTGTRNSLGYGVYSNTRYNHRKRNGAHRVSYEKQYGTIPEGMFVCHKCDNPSCVNPSHLFLGTAKDNQQDCIRKGRRGKPKPPLGELNSKK